MSARDAWVRAMHGGDDFPDDPGEPPVPTDWKEPPMNTEPELATRYRFKVTHVIERDFTNTEGWGGGTPAEAAEQEARWLNGLDDQGDYLTYALDEPSVRTSVSYEVIPND